MLEYRACIGGYTFAILKACQNSPSTFYGRDKFSKEQSVRPMHCIHKSNPPFAPSDLNCAISPACFYQSLICVHRLHEPTTYSLTAFLSNTPTVPTALYRAGFSRCMSPQDIRLPHLRPGSLSECSVS